MTWHSRKSHTIGRRIAASTSSSALRVEPESVSARVGAEDAEEEADDPSAEAEHHKRGEDFMAKSAGKRTDVVGSIV